jgi:hypothetical protein
MIVDDELEEFRQWRLFKSKQPALDLAFENLERIMRNPFYRGYDSAFRVMAEALMQLKTEVELKR